MMMDESKLIEKLRLIEALFSGAATEGERAAADHARGRILERLRELEAADPPVEYQFSMPDMWSRRVFLALLRRYGLRPYRYRRQRYTTVMVRVSQSFVDETLWPQYEQLSETLRAYLSNVTDRVVTQVLDADLSEAVVVAEPQALPISTASAPSPRPAPATSPAPAPSPAPATSPAAEATAATPRTSAPSSKGSNSKPAQSTRRNRQKRKRKKRRR